MDCIDAAQEHVMGCCECGNEPLGFIKCEGFLDKLRKCKHLKEDSIESVRDLARVSRSPERESS